jgi:hypothetical protein
MKWSSLQNLCQNSFMRSTLTESFEAGLLNKGSRLAQALGVTKFINMRDLILLTLCCAT